MGEDVCSKHYELELEHAKRYAVIERRLDDHGKEIKYNSSLLHDIKDELCGTPTKKGRLHVLDELVVSVNRHHEDAIDRGRKIESSYEITENIRNGVTQIGTKLFGRITDKLIDGIVVLVAVGLVSLWMSNSILSGVSRTIHLLK